jgi:glycine hydroxymethyltransferase
MKNGLEIPTGGTDNHLFLVKLQRLGINGRQGENALLDCGIILNRNTLPFDPQGPWYTSGLRIGTAAVTTLGMGTAEMEEIGSIIALALNHTTQLSDTKDPVKKSLVKYRIEENVHAQALDRVKKLIARFPVYPELDLELLKKAFLEDRVNR